MSWQEADGTGDDPGHPDDPTQTGWTPEPDGAPVPPEPETPPSVDELPELPPVAAPPVAAPAAPPAMAAPPPAAATPAPPPPGPPPWPGPSGAAPGPVPGVPAWAPPPDQAYTRYPVPGAPGLEFAGALPRFVAWIVDAIVLLFVDILALWAVYAVAGFGSTAASLIGGLIGVAVQAAYLIGLWTSGAKATLGMRLLKLQVGNAYDGRVLDTTQATRRWAAMGLWLSALGFTPALSTLSSLVFFGWWVVLLLTTIGSPTKQGFHDKFANTAVVRPIGAGENGLIIGCIVIIVALVALSLLSIVALIFLGNQVSGILSDVGNSI